MRLLRRWLEKPAPIATVPELEAFLDGNAAFVAQRCLYEYARALAGYAWQPLMEEVMFRAAMERSRWLAYPLGLALVTEVVEGELRLAVPGKAPGVLAALERSVAAILARHQPAAEVEPAAWAAAGERLRRHVQALQATPPLPVKDIAKPFAEAMLALVPIHERLRGRDALLISNNLTVSLLKAHDELGRRADRPALVAALLAGPPGAEVAG